MNITFRSILSIEECQSRLQNRLEHSVNDNWGEDVFIGKLDGTKFK